ncbi:MAG: hypothetical protein ACR2JW_19725 [Thermomicrobiales bacterium]
MSENALTPQQETYLTTLGHAFLIGTAIAKGSAPEEISDALKAGQHDNWYTVGTMAGMKREDTIRAVETLVAEGYIVIDTPQTMVRLRPRGAVWYITQVWGIAWNPAGAEGESR